VLRKLNTDSASYRTTRRHIPLDAVGQGAHRQVRSSALNRNACSDQVDDELRLSIQHIKRVPTPRERISRATSETTSSGPAALIMPFVSLSARFDKLIEGNLPRTCESTLTWGCAVRAGRKRPGSFSPGRFDPCRGRDMHRSLKEFASERCPLAASPPTPRGTTPCPWRISSSSASRRTSPFRSSPSRQGRRGCGGI